MTARTIDWVRRGAGSESGSDAGPAPEPPAVLTPENTRIDRERASRAFVPYLSAWCRRSVRQLGLDRVYIVCCSGGDSLQGDDPVRARAELREIRRTRRHAIRIAAQPLPYARREIARLAALTRRVPFELVTITRDVLCVLVPGGACGAPPEARSPIEIVLPHPQSLRFPVFIRTTPNCDSHLSVAFTRISGHGRCWGEAEPILEGAMERIDLCALVLAALAWARRNL